MAIRVSTPKLLVRTLHQFVRPLTSSSQPSPTTLQPLDVAENSITNTTSNASILDLNDAEKLFSSVPTPKLLRSSIILHMTAINPIVDFGTWLMKSKLMETFLLRDVIVKTIKHTFFEHFVAGESAEEAGLTVRRLFESGLRGMLDYGLEYADDNESCDRNLEGFFQTVESTTALPPSSVSFIVVKLTAICPMNLLKRVSDLLRWQHKHPSFHLPWKLNTLPIFSDFSPFYHTLEKPEPLTPEEEEDLQFAHQRLLILCQKCAEANVPLAIDAEYTWIQPAIDYLTYSSAIIHNKDKYPIVFGTIQAYLKDSKERLCQAVEAAEKMGVSVGIKLVRGAYLSSETQLATSMGFNSPIHKSIWETHECYNECASFLLEKLVNGSGGVVIATHNVESGKLAAAKARDLGIGMENQQVQFAQLYGMSEGLTFGLRNAGFVVSKYLPFGPVDMIIPYLLRRAEENRGVLSTSTLDRLLMRKELKRRLKASIF